MRSLYTEYFDFKSNCFDESPRLGQVPMRALFNTNSRPLFTLNARNEKMTLKANFPFLAFIVC